MSSVFLYLLIILSLGLIVKVIVNPKLIFEYPYFMGGMFLIFIVPQAIVLYNNYYHLPPGVLTPLLLMCFLCLLMVVLGYRFAPSIFFASKLGLEFSYSKLQRVGLVFTVIGYVFYLLVRNYYADAEMAGIEVSNQPSGIVTIFFLFSSVINLAFPVCLYLALVRPNVYNIVMAIVSSIPTLIAVISGGRREPTALFLLMIAFLLYRNKKFTPPRWTIVAVILFTMFFIPATGDYRDMSKRLGPTKAIQHLDFEKSFVKHYTEGFKYLELNVAAQIMNSYLFTGKFNYGSGYVNLIIFRYVPAQFFGKEFKESLYIGRRSSSIPFRNGYRAPTGITPTGIGDSFIQFGYFGCLFFFFLGGFFRGLWNFARDAPSPLLQIFYVICIVQALLSITHGTTNFIAGILFYFGCLWLGAAYAQNRASG